MKQPGNPETTSDEVRTLSDVFLFYTIIREVSPDKLCFRNSKP